MEGSPNYPAGEPRSTDVPRDGGTGDESSTSSRALESVQEHTREVASHAADEARGVVSEAADRLHDQAEQQTRQVQQAVQRTGEQLEALADGRVEDAGPVADYARRAAARVNDVADRMDRLGFDGVVSEVSDYARRRPGRFLLMAAGAGLVVGRLGRNARAASQDGQQGQSGSGGDRPSLRQVSEAGQAGGGPGAQAGQAAVQPAPVPPGVPPGFGTDPAPVGQGSGERRHG